MAKRTRTMSKIAACEKVARGLREFGYPDVTAETIKAVLDAWLSGKREFDLPKGVIGVIAGRQFDMIDEEMPGSLALLTE